MLNVQAFLDALPMMAKGMGGIFAVIVLIYITIVLLRRIPGRKE